MCGGYPWSICPGTPALLSSTETMLSFPCGILSIAYHQYSCPRSSSTAKKGCKASAAVNMIPLYFQVICTRDMGTVQSPCGALSPVCWTRFLFLAVFALLLTARAGSG